MSSKRAVCSEFYSETIKLLTELVFGANMGLFLHLSGFSLWMLRVTMLMQIIY